MAEKEIEMFLHPRYTNNSDDEEEKLLDSDYDDNVASNNLDAQKSTTTGNENHK
jgi:hypothetical protein